MPYVNMHAPSNAGRNLRRACGERLKRVAGFQMRTVKESHFSSMSEWDLISTGMSCPTFASTPSTDLLA